MVSKDICATPRTSVECLVYEPTPLGSALGLASALSVLFDWLIVSVLEAITRAD